MHRWMMRQAGRVSAGLAGWVRGHRRATLVGLAAVAVAALGVVATLSWPERSVRLAYVASAGNNHVQVIDLESGRTLRKIYAGATPWRLMVAPDRQSLWIQHWYPGTTAVVGLEDHEVHASFAARGPGTFTTSGDEFVSFDWPASTLRRFGARELEPRGEESTEVRKVYDVAADADGQRLFFAQHDPMARGPHDRYSYVLAYAAQAGPAARRATPASLPTGLSPVAIRTLSRGDFVITADRETNGLTLINRLGDRRAVPTCSGPQEIVVAPDEKRLIVACAPASGSHKGQLVGYLTDFGARPWPTLEREATLEIEGSLVAGSFSPSGDRVYLVDRERARLVELEPSTLRLLRELPTGDVPLDVVVLEVPAKARDRLLREEGQARARLRKILTELRASARPLVDLRWTEVVRTPPAAGSPAASARPERRVELAFRAPSSLRVEAEDGSLRLAHAGRSMSINPEGRFWVGPRQDLMAALLSVYALPVDQAIRELAGDVPGSPFLRGGLAVDLGSDVEEQSRRYHLIGSLRPGERVAQLWVDAESRRPTNLAEQFPSFAVSNHGGAGSGGIVETKFYDFVRTASGVELPTRLERVVEGRVTQEIRIEALRDNTGLDAALFDLAKLGGSPARPPVDAEVEPGETGDLGTPGRAVPILAAGYLTRPGEPHAPYNSSPPTSGPRLHDLADFGVHRVPIPPELQVHNLEHGAVLLQYHCPASCPELATELERYAERPFVMVAPYPQMDARIALTAWGRIQTLDEHDHAAIDRFIAAHAGKDHHQATEGPLSALQH